MDFKVGQVVRHIDTGEQGEVTAILSDTVAVVYFNKYVVKVERHASVLTKKLEVLMKEIPFTP